MNIDSLNKTSGQVYINKYDFKAINNLFSKVEYKHLNDKTQVIYDLYKDGSIFDEGLKNQFSVSNQEELFCKNINDPEIFINYLLHRYNFFIAAMGNKTQYPPYLLIEPASSCNLRCPMCFQVDKSFTKKPFMGLMQYDLFKKIIDEADLLGVGAVTLASRGEPTLHPKYADMLQYIGNKNFFEKKTNTNATRLTEDMCHSMLGNLDIIVISADHYEKETYEKIRLNAKFEQVVKNVQMLHNIKERNNYNNVEIRVSGVNVYKNLDVERFEKFWGDFSDSVTVGDAFERWDTYNNKPHSDINSRCRYLYDRMYIWWDGKCNPCDADYKSYLSYGNIKSNSIKDIWNSSDIQEKRKLHEDGKRNELIPCDRCGADFIE